MGHKKSYWECLCSLSIIPPPATEGLLGNVYAVSKLSLSATWPRSFLSIKIWKPSFQDMGLFVVVVCVLSKFLIKTCICMVKLGEAQHSCCCWVSCCIHLKDGHNNGEGDETQGDVGRQQLCPNISIHNWLCSYINISLEPWMFRLNSDLKIYKPKFTT